MHNLLTQIISNKAAGKKMLALLLDPEKTKIDSLAFTQQAKPDMILVGGSTGGDTTDFVRSLRTKMQQKELAIPIVLFPGNKAQFTAEADALLFHSLLSGRNAELLVGQQIAVAQQVKQSAIETIPMGYVLIDGGVETSVMRVSGTTPIDRNDIQTIVSTAIAAEMMGKEILYLEAGSGAKLPISSEIIEAVRGTIDIPIIVGGGIRTPQDMQQAYQAGADIVVVGNYLEENPDQLTTFTPTPMASTEVSEDDERYMSLALLEAQKALAAGEVPIGCVIVSQKQIIGRGHNLTEMLQDVTAHAEMQAITAATQTLGAKYMPDATLYVTVEPCIMCAGAIGWAQVKRIVYGAPDPKRGFQTFAPKAFHPKAQVTAGVLEEECRALVQQFFKTKR